MSVALSASFRFFLVAVAVTALVLLGGAGPARGDIGLALPASGSLTFYSASATGGGKDVFHEVQHGCGSGTAVIMHLVEPVEGLTSFMFVSTDGSFLGSCSYETASGTLSGSINLQDGTVTFQFEQGESFPNEDFRLTYDATGTVSGNGASGSANFTYSCSGDSCPEDKSDGGKIDWTMGFYQQPACTPGAPDCPDLKVDHIEVVQALPSRPDAGLVRGKSTVARVFVTADAPCTGDPSQTCDAFVTGVTATLTAEGPGGPLPGQGVNINTGPALAAGHNILRQFTNGSINFLLPDGWLGPGLTLKADVQPPPGITESNANNNQGSVSVTSFDSGRLDVDYVKICYPDPAHCPSDHVASVDGLLRKLAPVADNRYNYGPMPLPKLTYTKSLASYGDVAQFNSFLGRMYLVAALLDAQFFGSPPTMVFAWLPAEGAGGGYAILTDAQNHVWNGNGVAAWATESPHVPDFFLATSVGHNLGLGSAGGHVICSDQTTDAQTHWPYADVGIQDVGFDVTTRTVVKPSEYADLSAHCGANKTWVSPYSWEMMRKHLPGGGAESQPAADTGGQVYVVSGTVKSDGSSGGLDPVIQITSPSPGDASDPSGDFCLSLQGDGGELAQHCFSLDFHDPDGNAIEQAGFAFDVAAPAGVKRVVLSKGTHEVTRLEQSANAPSVEITTTVDGTLDGEYSIAWTNTDADGGPVASSVLYSPDGKNWYPLAVDTTDTSVPFDTKDLEGGNEVYFKVITSDGLNTGEDTLGPVSMKGGAGGILGDGDCDGDVDSIDALQVLRSVAGLPTTGGCLPAADVDCDGDVDSIDGLGILRHVAGLPRTPPEGCPDIG